MRHVEIPANEVRIPQPEPGAALLVTRYGSDQLKAVVLHPDDFMSIEEIIDVYLARPPHEARMSDLALRARAVTEARESAEEYDYAGLAAALEE